MFILSRFAFSGTSGPETISARRRENGDAGCFLGGVAREKPVPGLNGCMAKYLKVARAASHLWGQP